MTFMVYHSQQTVQNVSCYCLSTSCFFPGACHVRTWKCVKSNGTMPRKAEGGEFYMLRSDVL